MPCPLIDETPDGHLVIEMFRNKMFDLNRALCLFSNAWSQMKVRHIHVHRVNASQPIQRKDREALRRIALNREMAIAYTSRLQQAIH